jgi:hypothetical protein
VKAGRLRVQLLVVFAVAFVLLVSASLHAYRTLGGMPNKQHVQLRVLASLSILSGLVALGLAIGQWRFSIRTLLIATTLVAVLLGLVVYSVRN